MNDWKRMLCGWASVGMLAMAAGVARAEDEGQGDLDEALRVKVTAESMHDLNQVVELLKSAIQKGLTVENSDFAEQLLSQTLLERASQLTAILRSVPPANQGDERMQKVRALAVDDLRQVLVYDDAPPQAAMMLAQLESMTGGDSAEAEKLVKKAMSAESFGALPANDQAEAYLLQGTIMRQQNKADEAIASLSKAAELAPEAPEPHQALGEIYRALGKEKFPDAIAEFSKVLEVQPGSMLALIHRAEAYLANDQNDEALKDIETVLKANPQFKLAQGLRAQALANQDKLPEAIEEMKKLAEAAPDEAEFGLQLARFYLENKDPQKAIEVYTGILAKKSDDFLALRGRADAYLGIGDHAAAIADFERCLTSNPDDPGVLNNFAWVLATSPEDSLRNGKRAVELATKACEATDYKLPHILSTLAAAYAETGDFEAAKKWSQKAVEMEDPEHGEQLKAELASYEAKKPWRERQTIESATPATEAKPESNSAAEPAAAADPAAAKPVVR
jgi:tetratricopeptide (TPR) repeat protein